MVYVRFGFIFCKYILLFEIYDFAASLHMVSKFNI